MCGLGVGVRGGAVCQWSIGSARGCWGPSAWKRTSKQTLTAVFKYLKGRGARQRGNSSYWVERQLLRAALMLL